MTWALSAIALLAASAWAWRPLTPAATQRIAFDRPDPVAGTPETVQTIDLAAFNAKLWNPHRSEVTQEQAERPVARPPLRLELLAIIEENGQLKAALHDAETDSVLIVGSGEKVRTHAVTAVTSKAVELSDGQFSDRLILKEGPS